MMHVRTGWAEQHDRLNFDWLRPQVRTHTRTAQAGARPRPRSATAMKGYGSSRHDGYSDERYLRPVVVTAVEHLTVLGDL